MKTIFAVSLCVAVAILFVVEAAYGQEATTPPQETGPLELVPAQSEIGIARDYVKGFDNEFYTQYKQCHDFIDYSNTTMDGDQCQTVLQSAVNQHCAPDFSLSDSEICNHVLELETFYWDKWEKSIDSSAGAVSFEPVQFSDPGPIPPPAPAITTAAIEDNMTRMISELNQTTGEWKARNIMVND